MTEALDEFLQLGHCAVLVIDLQNDPCHPEGLYARLGRDISHRREAADRTAEFIAKAREHHVPIIYSRTNHGPWTESPAWRRRRELLGPFIEAYRAGTWGEDFYGVQPRDDEAVVVKHRMSVFVGTDLGLLLKSRGITSLAVTGGGTAACVESTVRHGLCLDYDIVVVSDCCGAVDAEEHRSALDRMAGLGALVSEWREFLAAWARKPTAARSDIVSR